QRRRRVVEIPGRPDPPRRGGTDPEGVVRQDRIFPRQFRYEVLMLLLRAGLAPLVVFLGLGAMLGAAEAQQKPPAAGSPAAPPAAPAVPAAPAAANPAPAVPANLSVLVVDVQSLLLNSKSAKMVRQQIEQKRAEYAKEISRQEASLRQERDTLQRQQG